MQEHGSRVMAAAESLAGGSMGADDIYQETFLIAWKKGGTLSREDSAGAWLVQVALNIGRKSLAKEVRRHTMLGAEMSNRRTRPTAAPTLEDELIKRWLWSAIDSLPDRQRRVLLARIAADTPSREVAESLGITMGTVRATLRDALRSLRKHMPDRVIEDVG